MPDEPEKPGGGPEADGSAEDAENERPTVSPPFDPIAFAREALKSSAGMPAAPGDAHTHVTPSQGVERQSAQSSVVLPARRKTPTSTLSLANARIPSNLPPRIISPPQPAAPKADGGDGPKRTDSLSEMNAVDREWADMEVATRPPPADGPGEDPVIELDRSPQLELDDAGVDDAHSADTVRRPISTDDLEAQVPVTPAPAPAKSREREMADRVSLGDYSGALEIAEKILADKPDDEAANACAENCRTVLRKMYAARIGPLDRVPSVMVPRDQLRWLSIDHKAGFVLSLVDGVSTLEMIIDVSGMAELDTLRILSELAQQRIISLR